MCRLIMQSGSARRAARCVGPRLGDDYWRIDVLADESASTVDARSPFGALSAVGSG